MKQAIFRLALAYYDYHLLGRNSRLPLLGHFLRLRFELTSVINKWKTIRPQPESTNFCLRRVTLHLPRCHHNYLPEGHLDEAKTSTASSLPLDLYSIITQWNHHTTDIQNEFVICWNKRYRTYHAPRWLLSSGKKQWRSQDFHYFVLAVRVAFQLNSIVTQCNHHTTARQIAILFGTSDVAPTIVTFWKETSTASSLPFVLHSNFNSIATRWNRETTARPNEFSVQHKQHCSDVIFTFWEDCLAKLTRAEEERGWMAAEAAGVTKPEAQGAAALATVAMAAE